MIAQGVKIGPAVKVPPPWAFPEKFPLQPAVEKDEDNAKYPVCAVTVKLVVFPKSTHCEEGLMVPPLPLVVATKAAQVTITLQLAVIGPVV